MANEGYLIGFEDAQGNFVQIGQFNNAADDVTKPLVLRHTNSGETLELDGSSFRPSTQIGDTNNRPDVFANTVDLNTLVGAGLDTKADLTQSGGVLVASQLPDLAITNIDVVADQNARLALDAEEGDVAIQTDISETFILSTNDPTVNSNWKQVQLDVLGAIDGQTITPAQTGTSTNPTTVESDTVTATNVEADQIGDVNNRPDLFADTVDANQLTGTDDINTRRIGDIVFAEGFNGSDPESRLDNALAAVGLGDRVMLENETYTKNRTISFEGTISGQSHGFRGATVTGDWTFTDPTALFHIEIGGDFTHNGGFATVFDCGFPGGSLTVNGPDMVITHCNGVDVTLNSNANVVALNPSGNTSITDNGGNNQIGLNA